MQVVNSACITSMHVQSNLMVSIDNVNLYV